MPTNYGIISQVLHFGHKGACDVSEMWATYIPSLVTVSPTKLKKQELSEDNEVRRKATKFK